MSLVFEILQLLSNYGECYKILLMTLIFIQNLARNFNLVTLPIIYVFDFLLTFDAFLRKMKRTARFDKTNQISKSWCRCEWKEILNHLMQSSSELSWRQEDQHPQWDSNLGRCGWKEYKSELWNIAEKRKYSSNDFSRSGQISNKFVFRSNDHNNQDTSFHVASIIHWELGH